MEPEQKGVYRRHSMHRRRCRFCCVDFISTRKDAECCSAKCRKAWSRGMRDSLERTTRVNPSSDTTPPNVTDI